MVELAIEELKIHGSLGSDQISSELIKARCRTNPMRYETYYFYFNKEELPDEWKSRSLFLSIRREIKETVVIIGAYQFSLLYTKYFQTSCLQS